jgi:hypothetical protein
VKTLSLSLCVSYFHYVIIQNWHSRFSKVVAKITGVILFSILILFLAKGGFSTLILGGGYCKMFLKILKLFGSLMQKYFFLESKIHHGAIVQPFAS